MLEVRRMGVGTDVVIVQGSPQPPEDLLPLAQALTLRHRVHLVALPGWGRSDTGAVGNLDATADAIVASLAGIERAAWVGSSFGFWRALQLQERGLTASALVGLAPVARFDSGSRGLFMASADLVRSGTDLGAILVQRFLAPAFAAAHPDHAAAVARFCDQAPRAVIANELASLADAPDLDGVLARVKVPVYLRVGELDPAAPPAEVQALGALCGARVDVVPGVGHLLAREDLAGTTAAVLAFLKGAGA